MGTAETDGSPWGRRWLRKVTIERFKAAFRPPPIALHPFTVIIGRNGSGKSTLLEALHWLDTTMRHDAQTACERYHGVHDLINLRSQASRLFFSLGLQWSNSPTDIRTARGWNYSVRVEEQEPTIPTITEETLYFGKPDKRDKRFWIKTEGESRQIINRGTGSHVEFAEPDRLALSRGWRIAGSRTDSPDAFKILQDFWNRAVFLRLSPNRLAAGSLARRRSFDPLLDEEGHTLPALLNELNEEQKNNLVAAIQGVLADIEDVEITGRRSREERVHYSLRERMPYRGRAGRSSFAIPAWMLSEGTRRITAIFALLEHDPPPSMLCIEEIENGLDPWTVIQVLQRLQSAVDNGTQVILTTHSPWLLDHVPLEAILHVKRTEGETIYKSFMDEAEIKAFAASVPPGTRYVREGG